MSQDDITSAVLADIDQKFPLYRSNKRWGCPVYGYRSVGDFLGRAQLRNGIHTVFDGSLPIDLHLTVDWGRPLIIFLNARSSERTESYRLPSFVGFGVVPEGRVSVLRISDPVLYTSRTLRIGWYAGARGQPLLMRLNNLIAKVISMLAPTKVIFVGGSAGGFVALNLSRFVAESLAVVWNPQTDLLKFSKDEVMEFATSAYGISDFETCQRLLPALTVSSLHKYYRRDAMRNYVLYMQNVDDWHTREHCKPFLLNTGRDLQGGIGTRRFDDRFFLYAADWGKGHASPPQAFLKYLLRALYSDEISFDGRLFSGEIDRILCGAEAAL